MNLNKYTKAELISKIKKLDSKNDSNPLLNNLKNIKNNITDYFSNILKLIITFKNIWVKLTLISLVISIFKKYKIFRKLWFIINSIIMTIFGISLIDNFGFSFISNLFNELRFITGNIVDYLSKTNFYVYLNKLFSNKEEPSSESTNKSRSVIESNKTETIRSKENSTESEGNSRISEWLKPQKEAYEEIKENNNNYKYFLIITGIIVLSSLSWYYSDEIKSGFAAIITWILSFRPGGTDDPGTDYNNNSTPTPTNIQKSVDNSTSTSPDIELVDKGKSKILASPSLEDLNEKVTDSWNTPTSPTSSTSSTDTIKPYTSTETKSKIYEIKKLPHFPFADNFLDDINVIDKSNISDNNPSLLNIKDNWKNIIKSDLKESIIYVENHLPKCEIDDTTYINQLLEEINRKNTEYLRAVNANINNLGKSQLIYLKDIGKELDKWTEEIRKEISKFD